MPIKRVSKGRIIPEKKPVKSLKPKVKKISAPAPKPTPAPAKVMANKPKAKVSDKADASYSAKNITILEGLEAVRRRPGMYIGSTGPVGLHHLIWEVVDNSIDEAMAGFCTQINITLLPDHYIEVKDNGRGIPVDIHPQTGVSALEVVLTKLHAGGKFDAGSYKVSGGLHGVGVSVVNALSTHVKAEVHRDGKVWLQEYKNGGNPVKKVHQIGTTKDRGTIITFRADDTIFETIDYEWKTIIDHVRQQVYLSKGIRIAITDKRTGAEKDADKTALPFPNPTYQFYFEGGIASYVRHLNQNKEVKNENVFYVEKVHEDVKVEIALQYSDEFTESLFAFTNNIYNPEGGTHVAGFRTALTRSLNSYARNKNILKEKDSNLTGEDVREGLNCIISVKVTEPQFEGQTKAKLGNTEVKTAVEAVMNDEFLVFLEEHPKDAEGIVGKCLLAARARNAAKIARDTILRKGALEGFTLPGKLADCSSRRAEESELFIVEGDSAGGCWDGNTLVALADGRALSFKEIIKEQSEGKEHFCYTIRNDGKIGLERIINPRRTKTNATVIKITLDNGEILTCTPDHLFMTRDGSYKQAQLLTAKDSLMPLYKKISNKKERGITIDGYEMVWDPKSDSWLFTHMLADWYNRWKGVYKTTDGDHRHHMDFNKRNNNPSNLLRISKESHLELHRKHVSKTLHRPDVIEKCRKIKQDPQFRTAMSARMKQPETAALLSKNAKKQWQNTEYKNYMTKKFLEFYNNNEEYRQKNNELLNKAQQKYWSDEVNKINQAERVTKFFEEHPYRKEWLRELAAAQWNDSDLKQWRSEKTKEQWTLEFRTKRREAYNQTYLQNSLAFAKKILEQGQDLFVTYNLTRKNLPKRDNNIVKLETLLDRFFAGDKNRLLEATTNFNHKITKIEKVKEKIDVYDIEVPGTHNFALASGIFVHNSAKQGRDREHQAILPLRGKVLNVERARLDKILTNNELKSLIIAMGTNIGEALDISKLRYHRVIIMTDADVDGAHIRTLLLTFFYRYYPTLITGGHILIAQPPLYSLKYGKNMKYAYNDEEKEKILLEIKNTSSANSSAKAAAKKAMVGASSPEEAGETAEGEVQGLEINGIKVNIQRYKGLGEMNPEQLWETTMNPKNRMMKRVTIEDAELANEVFEILMGDEVAPRKKFIQTHAKSVSNLDI
ncbi:MAG: DNA gyrase subunit B [Parcubacteria group bacterium Gr01-1014_13]|nr:MAG: DNA gyrase subunit B [Parcubacteria group bacterium Gr01-1014_13]